MIDESKLRDLYPEEADSFLDNLNQIRENMIQPQILQSFIFEPDLLADRESLSKQIVEAKKQLNFFCMNGSNALKYGGYVI